MLCGSDLGQQELNQSPKLTWISRLHLMAYVYRMVTCRQLKPRSLPAVYTIKQRLHQTRLAATWKLSAYKGDDVNRSETSALHVAQTSQLHQHKKLIL